jgi:anti-sigma B factor antagonist
MSTEAAIKIQVLRLRGELGLEDVVKVRTLLSEYLMAGRVNVVLNLERVNHVHLGGMPVLGERARRLREYGGDLKICGASPYLRHTFDLAGVGTAFDFCLDEDEAAKRFQNQVHAH